MDSSFLAHSSHFFSSLSFDTICPHSTHVNVMVTPPRARMGNVPAWEIGKKKTLHGEM
jgi:hypothetical protein